MRQSPNAIGGDVQKHQIRISLEGKGEDGQVILAYVTHAERERESESLCECVRKEL